MIPLAIRRHYTNKRAGCIRITPATEAADLPASRYIQVVVASQAEMSKQEYRVAQVYKVRHQFILKISVML